MIVEPRGRRSKSNPLGLEPEVCRLIQQRRRAFRKHFGRDPRPDESLKFRPDQETPDVLTDDDVRRILAESMSEAEIDARFIYAFKKTGVVVLHGKKQRLSTEQIAAWELALEEYDEMLAKGGVM